MTPDTFSGAGRSHRTLDRLIQQADQALRAIAGGSVAQRPYPGDANPESLNQPRERRHVAGLMRVNHAGEIAAQALYHGQALTARSESTRVAMLQAAREEADHLAWCEQRLRELDSRPSYLAPFWYLGSLAIGAAAGLAGDKMNLGFVAETERQVVEHLDGHLNQLPSIDARTRAVIEQMQVDEARHGASATRAGGVPLPKVLRRFMRSTARLMTRTAYWI